MSVLLMRLAGPMQAWGTQSRFTIRDTGLEPSKSAVLGLLCAVLGKPRDETLRPDLPSLRQLAELRMGVRVDRPGRMAVDFHTAQDIIKVSGKRPRTQGDPRFSSLSQRYYLADAEFLVGLEGDAALLDRLDAALADPVWLPYLGRKAFVPAMPIATEPPPDPSTPLLDALKAAPWYRRTAREAPEGPLRIIIEQPPDQEGESRNDVPLCFQHLRRDFTVRRVRDAEFWTVPEHLIKEWPPCSSTCRS